MSPDDTPFVCEPMRREDGVVVLELSGELVVTNREELRRCADAELANAPEPLVEVVLAPGEALFIPAGWWHQVDALDVSISVSILSLAWPNDFSWYKPGTALAGRRAGG